MDQLTHWIEEIVLAWVGTLEESGYWGIFLLMAIESSFIPFPSEIVMIPAGALAKAGKINFWGAIAAGTAGSLAGALFNYYFALLLGRQFLLRFGKYIFLPPEKLEWAEQKWHKHGEVSTFVCRFLPAIRQLISIPAGLARMNLAKFCLWTTLGAGLWVWVLTLTGYLLGEKAHEFWDSHKREVTLGLFALGAVIVVGYVAWHLLRRRSPLKSSATAADE